MELKKLINKRFLQAADRLIKEGRVISYRAFCQAIGVHNSTYNDIKSGRRSVTIEIMESLSERFGISYSWLMNQGDEFYSDKQAQKIHHIQYGSEDDGIIVRAAEPETVYKRAINKVYLLEESGDLKMEFWEELKTNSFSGAETICLPWLGQGDFFSFKIKGNGMLGTLSPGDRVVAKEVPKERLRNGTVYVIITPEEVFCKRFYEYNNSVFLFTSDNTDVYTKPNEVKKEAVIAAFEVVEFISADLSGNFKDKEILKLYKQLLQAKGISL